MIPRNPRKHQAPLEAKTSIERPGQEGRTMQRSRVNLGAGIYTSSFNLNTSALASTGGCLVHSDFQFKLHLSEVIKLKSSVMTLLLPATLQISLHRVNPDSRIPKKAAIRMSISVVVVQPIHDQTLNLDHKKITRVCLPSSPRRPLCPGCPPSRGGGYRWWPGGTLRPPRCPSVLPAVSPGCPPAP